jgi:hypothetical protein
MGLEPARTAGGGSAALERFLWSVLDRPVVQLTLLAVSAALLFVTGVIGVGRPNSGFLGGGIDFDFFYYAGRMWLKGESPYDVTAFLAEHPSQSSFAYPPFVFVPCVFWALFPHDVAEFGMQLLSFAAAVVIVAGAVELAEPSDRLQRRRMLVLTAVLVLSSPFTSHVLWLGQSSLVGAALVVGAFVCYRRGWLVGAGMLAALALSKPQLSLLPVLWLTAGLNKRFLLSLAATACVLVVPPVLMTGPVEFVGQYLNSVQAYQTSHLADISFRHTFGLRSFADSLGFDAPSLAPVAFALAVVAYRYRNRFRTQADVLAYLLVVSLLFVYAHDYDIAVAAPLIPALYRHARVDLRTGIALLLGVLLLYFPTRFLVPLDIPWLLRYRELTCLGYLVVLVALNWYEARARSDGQPAANTA